MKKQHILLLVVIGVVLVGGFSLYNANQKPMPIIENNTADEDTENENLTWYAELIRFETLATTTINDLSEQEKAQIHELVAEGQAIINNRMAVTSAKITQLNEISTQIENILKL